MDRNGGDKQAAFDSEWESFYELAGLVMGRVSKSYLQEAEQDAAAMTAWFTRMIFVQNKNKKNNGKT